MPTVFTEHKDVGNNLIALRGESLILRQFEPGWFFRQGTEQFFRQGVDEGHTLGCGVLFLRH